MASRRVLAALNVGFDQAAISLGSPVRGLRARRMLDAEVLPKRHVHVLRIRWRPSSVCEADRSTVGLYPDYGSLNENYVNQRGKIVTF